MIIIACIVLNFMKKLLLPVMRQFFSKNIARRKANACRNIRNENEIFLMQINQDFQLPTSEETISSYEKNDYFVLSGVEEETDTRDESFSIKIIEGIASRKRDASVEETCRANMQSDSSSSRNQQQNREQDTTMISPMLQCVKALAKNTLISPSKLLEPFVRDRLQYCNRIAQDEKRLVSFYQRKEVSLKKKITNWLSCSTKSDINLKLVEGSPLFGIVSYGDYEVQTASQDQSPTIEGEGQYKQYQSAVLSQTPSEQKTSKKYGTESVTSVTFAAPQESRTLPTARLVTTIAYKSSDTRSTPEIPGVPDANDESSESPESPQEDDFSAKLASFKTVAREGPNSATAPEQGLMLSGEGQRQPAKKIIMGEKWTAVTRSRDGRYSGGGDSGGDSGSSIHNRGKKNMNPDDSMNYYIVKSFDSCEPIENYCKMRRNSYSSTESDWALTSSSSTQITPCQQANNVTNSSSTQYNNNSITAGAGNQNIFSPLLRSFGSNLKIQASPRSLSRLRQVMYQVDHRPNNKRNSQSPIVMRRHMDQGIKY